MKHNRYRNRKIEWHTRPRGLPTEDAIAAVGVEGEPVMIDVDDEEGVDADNTAVCERAWWCDWFEFDVDCWTVFSAPITMNIDNCYKNIHSNKRHIYIYIYMYKATIEIDSLRYQDERYWQYLRSYWQLSHCHSLLDRLTTVMTSSLLNLSVVVPTNCFKKIKNECFFVGCQ